MLGLRTSSKIQKVVIQITEEIIKFTVYLHEQKDLFHLEEVILFDRIEKLSLSSFGEKIYRMKRRDHLFL